MMRPLYAACSLIALGVGICQDASAQTSGAIAAPATEEVVVTARRREERLQDVPAAVSVISARTIEAAGVQSLNDLARLVPNFSFDSGYRAGIPMITLRGIPTAQGGEAPVAVLIDGVQVPGLDFINQDLLDIASVEVLRGPQGAMYGRGAIAGALVINTSRPTDDISNNFLASYGNGNTSRVVDTLSGPLVPGKVWAKVTLSQRYTEGLVDDAGLHRPGDWARQHSAHAELIAALTDQTTAEFRVGLTRGVDGASYLTMVPDGQINNFELHPSRNRNTADTRNLQSYALKLSHETPYGTFSSISQYARSLSEVFGDADWTTAPVATQDNRIKVRAFNQDFRFASPSDQPVTWMVGAFFQHRKTNNFLRVVGEPGGPLPGLLLASGDAEQHSTAYAAYSQIGAQLPADFKLSAAVRFDVDKRYDDDRGVRNSSVKNNYYALQPQLTLSRAFTPDVNGYATVGRGFRSGGFNGYLDSITLGLPRQFPKETSTNYEIGIKSQWLDRKLTLNASLYHTDYKNQQFYFVNASPPARNIVTIKDVSMNGGELELSLRPDRAWLFTGTLGVTDAEIDDFNGTSLYVGNKSPNSYRYNLDLAVEYTLPLGNQFEATARAEYQRLGSIYYDVTSNYRFGPTDYVNARIGVRRGGWGLALWGKNLTNQRAPATFGPNAFGPGIGGRTDNQPLRFGVEVTSRF